MFTLYQFSRTWVDSSRIYAIRRQILMLKCTKFDFRLGALLNRSLFHVGIFRHLKHVLHFHVRQFHVRHFQSTHRVDTLMSLSVVHIR